MDEWIVVEHYYDAYEMGYGVFSSKEEAEEWGKKHITPDSHTFTTKLSRVQCSCFDGVADPECEVHS
jgi:hypothetical protein